MIDSAIARIVETCARYRWTTIIAGILLMPGTGTFAAAIAQRKREGSEKALPRSC